jgi:uncharacterized protein (DUF58 family)
VLFPYIQAKTTRRTDYSVRLTQRGRYRLESLRTSTRFPFGLILYELTLPCENEVIVLPRLGRLSRRWHRLPLEMNQGSGNVQRRQATMEGDFYGLREWRSDDSRSWIHWRSSAKRQTLMVKQFEQQRSQNVRLVLDLWQPEKPQPEHLANVELAVSFAATIVVDACQRGGATLCLTTAGSGITIRGPASPGLMQEALESLAVADAKSPDRLPETLAETLDEIRPGTRVIVISTRPVRLNDTQRFANIWRDQRRQAALGRVLTIDCSQSELFQFYSAQ